MNLGATEVILVVAVALLLFGPSKLPGLGKSLGQAIRGFKSSLNSIDKPEKKEDSDSDSKKS